MPPVACFSVVGSAHCIGETEVVGLLREVDLAEEQERVQDWEALLRHRLDLSLDRSDS